MPSRHSSRAFVRPVKPSESGVVRVERLFGRTVVQREVVIQDATIAVAQFLDNQSLTS
jgi:hypothetical protein